MNRNNQEMKETHSILHVKILFCMLHLQMRIRKFLQTRNLYLASKLNNKLVQYPKHSNYSMDNWSLETLVSWFTTQDCFTSFHSQQNQIARQFYFCNILFKFFLTYWKNAKTLKSNIIMKVQQENQMKSEKLSRPMNAH